MANKQFTFPDAPLNCYSHHDTKFKDSGLQTIGLVNCQIKGKLLTSFFNHFFNVWILQKINRSIRDIWQANKQQAIGKQIKMDCQGFSASHWLPGSSPGLWYRWHLRCSNSRPVHIHRLLEYLTAPQYKNCPLHTEVDSQRHLQKPGPTEEFPQLSSQL